MRSFTTASFAAAALLLALCASAGAGQYAGPGEPAFVQEAAAVGPDGEGVALEENATVIDGIAETRETGGDRNNGDYDIPDPCPG